MTLKLPRRDKAGGDGNESEFTTPDSLLITAALPERASHALVSAMHGDVPLVIQFDRYVSRSRGEGYS